MFNVLRVSMLTTVILLLLAPGMAFASEKNEDKVTLGEFAKLEDPRHPENSFLPSNHSQLSQDEFMTSSTHIGPVKGNIWEAKQTQEGQPQRILTEFSTHDLTDDKFDSNIPKKAIFTFDDQTTLTISEDAIININNHVYNPEKDLRKAIKNQNTLALNEGMVSDVPDYTHIPDQNLNETVITVFSGWARLRGIEEGRNGSSIKLVTPSATAGVNGSEFLAVVDPQGKTTFLVVKGQIAAFSNQSEGHNGKLSLISEGEAQDFFPDGSHSTVRRLLKNF